jgi:polyhydroxybutyrate depolymerase
MINGTEDKITWWYGDLNDMQHYGAYFPVLTTFGFFVRKNKCTNLLTDTLPGTNTRDGSYIITNKYTGGINGNQVWLWTVVKGGHDWIGKGGNLDFNASEEIWNFFKLI